MVETKALRKHTRVPLQVKQEKERQQLNTQLNSLFPINQLPAEIKAEIFFNALGSLTDFVGVTPFFLGKICRCWRDVVWSTPILWTTLHLRLSRDNYKAQAALLRDWLFRTGKLPISFCLETKEFLQTAWPWRYHPPVQVLTLFASVSARWREIYISFYDLQACLKIISPAKKPLPLLTTATIQVVLVPEGELDLLNIAPQLSELRIHASRSLGLLRVLVAPWQQLQEFFAEHCCRDEIRFVLHNAPHIVRCTFKAIETRYSLHPPDEQLRHRPLLLEHLQYLELHFKFDDVRLETGWIFGGQVTLPSLREFSLINPDDNEPQDAVLLQITNLLRSSPRLEKFTWSALVLEDHNMIQALNNIPSVKDLSLNFLGYLPVKLLTEEFLKRLNYPHPEILLPNLRSFSYHGATSLNGHMHLLRDVLVRRFRKCAPRADKIDSERTAVAQLKSVSMTSTSELVISSDIQEELNSLVQEGLEFKLQFRTNLGMKLLRTLNGVLVLI
ncbi:uncharacterized protein LACBIDRAFT_306323 [Laccaria bicolor S238N-H82]|uniref:Predicted protein n=1 Tax=Laccaria bicolor (strain S238N-H82 / ATCC MYA-4686) TaxID=486041 RepID=B0DN44_LACBS|nr:uncharacterized protein LACBIDRAFT_306323 [Laccaria bicolor S238N-H82]EDR04078.1 predicted protein [Laccaria bicolor S238N-H82]|eukprot:XP_001885333.1 predicted protein [Laccaria bicolor S238N-H82]